jgi:hypothetical protein
MKKTYLLLLIPGVLAISCQKGITNENSLPSSISDSSTHFTVVTGDQKTQMLSSMSVDSLFLDYMKTLIEVQKYYAELLLMSPNYDFKKKLSETKVTTEQELISRLKSAGMENPESLLAKINVAKQKLVIVYNKYPAFTRSLNELEKKVFYKSIIDKLLDAKP